MGIETARFSSKTDNNPRAFTAKVDIRQRVFNEIAATGDVRVFDAYAGSGEMYSAVWNKAKAYTGCDLKWERDGRRMFVGDNRRVMRSIDLRPFNVFDLDAYGSPWEQAIIVAGRRRVGPGELFGLVLTEGSGLAMKVNVIAGALQELTGLRTGAAGVFKNRDFICNRAITGLARRMSCTVVKQWRADGKTGASMRYIGLVLKGRG
jgi:hypothetical protein